MRKLSRGWVRTALCAGLISLFSAGDAKAASITLYSTLADWQTDTNELWLVDFSSFLVNTEFRTSAVDAGPFTLDEIGGRDFRNLIEVSPFQFNDGSGSTQASLYTNFGDTTVVMTFLTPLVAWGADFYTLDAELVDLVLNLSGGGSEPIPLGAGSYFFGFKSSEPVSSLTFQSRMEFDGRWGEGFVLDDVRGASATPALRVSTIPEPSALVLLGTALFLVGLRRRQR